MSKFTWHARVLSAFSFAATQRSLRVLIVGAAVALTGCATTKNHSDQAALDDLFNSLESTQYAYATQSDPLGSYLKNRRDQDVFLSRSSDSSTADSAPNIASTALNFLGVKYRYGGDDPSTGFDCSGLVNYVAEKSLGLKLPRQSAEIAKHAKVIKRSELKEGDLVFFNTLGARFSHVGIYLGDNKFVHAPRSGAVVRIEDMTIAYWNKRFTGARRIVANTTATP